MMYYNNCDSLSITRQKLAPEFDVTAFSFGNFAGDSGAMGNSSTELKSLADYVTDDVDKNGIANALQHLNLI